MTVLLVEDEPTVQEVLIEALTSKGFLVHVAAGGEEAMRHLRSDAPRYKAAIIDIRLADDVLGWDVSQFAREMVHDLPIVYISARDAQDWKALGVPNSVMLPKPLSIPVLMSILEDLVAEHKASLLAPGFAEADNSFHRLDAVRELSDETLTRYYELLSDERLIVNAAVLPEIEAEIRRRGLPVGRQH